MKILDEYLKHIQESFGSSLFVMGGGGKPPFYGSSTAVKSPSDETKSDEQRLLTKSDIIKTLKKD